MGLNKIKNPPIRIYEDDDWVIEKFYESDENSQIRITCFRDNHFVDNLMLTSEMFKEEDLIDKVKDILY